ncbi:MAG: hypothetical protein IT178_01615 [Acidobacteria bacterium]|nr:hypothetical protein [Acidobacteriota bacterium]
MSAAPAQTYANHAHRPWPTLVATLLWLIAVIAFAGALALGWDTRDMALGWLLAAMLVVISMSRSYITKLQDRIIMLEMKVRCAEALPVGDDAKLMTLSPKQIAALRFASDAELGALLDRAVREQMTPTAIKQAVAEWRPDPHRT